MKRIENVCTTLLMSLVFVYSSCNSFNDSMVQKINIDKGWKFKQTDSSEWMPATVPGTVHTDLFSNGIIEDPFYRLNEQDQQWIDKQDWEYKCEFEIDKQILKKEIINMKFHGLDTYAEVRLNDSIILNADNMFRCWKTNVKPYLKEGKNELHIIFYSAIKQGKEKLKEFGYNLPAANDQSETGGVGKDKLSVFTRKAPYHYGWDWGPRFVTCGVWRPVEIEAYNTAIIEDIHYRIITVADHEAKMEAVVELNSVDNKKVKLKLENESGKEIYYKEEHELQEGKNKLVIPFMIENPERWWPNGMGEQYLYNIKATVKTGEKPVDQRTDKIGIRTIELVKEKDSVGTSFYFKVNEIPVFAKGANYIPNDNFLTRVTEDKYRHILESARKSNMNMIRVWGGGIYENDVFYNLCDELGLMVWQDFMFACSMYPGNEEFLQNVKQEAVDNVKRLRNHACIALWCGNNEIDAAWCQYHEICGWIWKQRYNGKQRTQLWKAYKDIFLDILPDVIKEYDPDRSYWPSSPMADYGKVASYKTVNEGDMHYWGVWHGKKHFEEFDDVIGRFMSEYGFQSFPDFNTVKKYTIEEDWDIESEVMASHQRSGIGNLRIKEYMGWYYNVPRDFEHFLYVGQILQAAGIRKAMEAHRSKMPHCMGSLYWQLNDCWPVASWSSLDYYGNWKALQYAAKKAYAPTIVTFNKLNDNLKVVVVNDLLEGINAELEISVFTFTGEKIFGENTKIIVEPNSAKEFVAYNLKNLYKNSTFKDAYVVARLKSDSEILASNIFYAAFPKKLKLEKPSINIDRKKVTNGYMIVLSTDVLAKDVFLSTSVEGHFTDNYFDLLPEERKTIFFIPDNEIEGDIPEIEIITLKDVN